MISMEAIVVALITGGLYLLRVMITTHSGMTAASNILSWQKNNSFTKEALREDEILVDLREMK